MHENSPSGKGEDKDKVNCNVGADGSAGARHQNKTQLHGSPATEGERENPEPLQRSRAELKLYLGSHNVGCS